MCVININDKVSDYCEEIFQKLKKNGLRPSINLDDKPLQQKIAIESAKKIPYLLIIGDKEKETNNVSIRIFGDENGRAVIMPIDQFIESVKSKIASKSLTFDL
jgi:threonyl-tRNA synthetase